MRAQCVHLFKATTERVRASARLWLKGHALVCVCEFCGVGQAIPVARIMLRTN